MEPMTESVDVENMKSTPVVIHMEKKLVEKDEEEAKETPKTLLSFVNKAADTEEEDGNNEAPKRKESKKMDDGTKDPTLIAAEQNENPHLSFI